MYPLYMASNIHKAKCPLYHCMQQVGTLMIHYEKQNQHVHIQICKFNVL